MHTNMYLMHNATKCLTSPSINGIITGYFRKGPSNLSLTKSSYTKVKLYYGITKQSNSLSKISYTKLSSSKTSSADLLKYLTLRSQHGIIN